MLRRLSQRRESKTAQLVDEQEYDAMSSPEGDAEEVIGRLMRENAELRQQLRAAPALDANALLPASASVRMMLRHITSELSAVRAEQSRMRAASEEARNEVALLRQGLPELIKSIERLVERAGAPRDPS